MNDDMALVREFAANQSEEAFQTLVSRHLNLVYSSALRQVRDEHLAQEIAQATFIILARKASSLSDKTILSGWLYRTAQFAAADALKMQRRRQMREQEAFMQATTFPNETESTWEQLSPFLDEAMARLRDEDRDALVLRFFENKNLKEVGAALGLEERAAQKRVSRGLEKLRTFFARRGMDSTAANIAEKISANSVHAAPVALAKTISAVAISKGAVAGGSTLTLVKGALKIMAWTKMKTAAVVGISTLLIVGAPTVTVMAIHKSRADAIENYFAHWDKFNMDMVPLPEVVVLRPSKYANKGNLVLSSSDLGPKGRLMRRGAAFTDILQTAYGFGPEQMVLPANLPKGQFDMLLTVPKNSRELLRAEIKKQYGIVAHPETRDTDVIVLKVVNTNAPGIKISAGGGPNIWENRGSLKLIGYKITDPSGFDIAHVIGSFYNQPVIDETGLTDKFDVDAKWNGNLRGTALQKEIERVMREQFGLEVVKDKQPVEMLVVEKTK